MPISEAKPIYEQKVRVNNFDCDFNRRWKPAAFFQYMSETAGRHAAELGVGYEAMLAQNLFWVHVRIEIKFHIFPKAGDEIIIRTWPKTIQQKLFFIRDFEIFDEQSTLMAAATSAWLVINATTRRIVPSNALDLQLPRLEERIGLNEPLEKLDAPADGEERLRVKAGYSAVDLLGHVNNSRYVEWICDCLPADLFHRYSLDWLQINYEREVRPGETVSLLANESGHENDLWTIVGVNQTHNQRAFEAELKLKTGAKNNPK